MLDFFRKNKKLIVISLDGVPYTFLEKIFKEGKMPNLRNFTETNSFIRMNSVIPPISSVAWASFMTGKEPSGHGLFGFMDRYPNPFKTFIPFGKDIKSETLWMRLSREKKKVIVLNVPSTTPPEKVNGIMVSGFLSMNLKKAVYPAELISELESSGYIVDAEPRLAHKDKKAFMNQLHKVLEGRLNTVLNLLENKKWDFFMCHVMETDRLCHFYWKNLESNGEFTEKSYLIFNKIDIFIGKLIKKYGSDKNIKFLFLSDHGFCTVKKEVNLNAWLKQIGLLKFKTAEPANFNEMVSSTKVYSLIPGRFYINLKSREEMGAVEEEDYENVLNELTEKLKSLKDEDGMQVIDKIFRRDEIYKGAYKKDAPDLVVLPVNGYDLKQNIKSNEIFSLTNFEGMHTYDDAFLSTDMEIEFEQDFSIDKVFSNILTYYKINM